MGLLHGTYCIGCCWLLMALLFVGGVMNLAWIALLTLMVAAEKLLPFGRFLSIATGSACIVWGAVMLLG
jgi:predicted metal-binding membrane protein